MACNSRTIRSFSALFLLTFVTPNCAWGQDLPRLVPLTPSVSGAETRQTTWQEALAQSKADSDRVVKHLIAIVEQDLDERLRRAAIKALAKVGNKEAITYLVENIRVRWPVECRIGDGLADTPCFGALVSVCDGNWEVARISLESLDKYKSSEELSQLCSLVRGGLGEALARAAIVNELSRNPTGYRKDNLSELHRLMTR